MIQIFSYICPSFVLLTDQTKLKAKNGNMNISCCKESRQFPSFNLKITL